MAEAEGTSITVKIEFTGGLETLFENVKSTTVTFIKTDPASQPTVATLLHHIDRHILPKTSNRALFLTGQPSVGKEGEDVAGEIDVRPGILVLINDYDWELEGGLETVLKDGDEVLFVSTLHGG